MKQNNFSYPKYREGEVLTHEALNNSFNYLEEQNRLSRTELSGTGIINGLEYFFDDNTLTIKAGTASTSDGTLIVFDKDKTYSAAIKKNLDLENEPMGYQFYEKEDDIEKALKDKIEWPSNYDKYVVALHAIYEEETDILCSGNSCDKDTVSKKLCVYPILLENVKQQYLQIKPINSYIYFKTNHDGKNSNQLSDAITELSKGLDNISECKLFPGEGNTMNNWKNILEINNSDTFSDTIRYQAIADSVNQVIVCYNQFASKYPFIPCDSEPHSYIALGKGTDSYSDDSKKYRNLFQSVLYTEFTADYNQLSNAVNHIFEVWNFYRNNNPQNISVGFLKNDLTQLTGFGIVSGLDYEYKYNNLTVHKGKAVTFDGLVLEFKEDISLGKIDNFSTLNNRVIALKIEYQKGEPSYAVNETDFHYTIYACAYDKSSNEYTKPYHKPEAIQIFANTKNIGSIDNALNINVFKKKLVASFKASRDSIVSVLKAIYEQIKDSENWKIVLGNDATEQTNLFNSLINEMNTLEEKRIDLPGLFPIYYLHFLEDMAEATNEFVEYYNDFVSRYPLIPMNNTSEDGVVYLGCGNSNVENDAYRNVYRTLFDTTFANDCKVFARLLNRLYLMKKHFVQLSYYEQSHAAQFVWSDAHDRIGNRPIPYYYDRSSELENIWDAHHASHLPYKNRIGNPEYQKYSDTLSLQNIVDMEVDDVCRELKTFLYENNLPINVKTIELKKKKYVPSYGSFFINKNRFIQLLTRKAPEEKDSNPRITILEKKISTPQKITGVKNTYHISRPNLKDIDNWPHLLSELNKNMDKNKDDNSSCYLIRRKKGNGSFEYVIETISDQYLPENIDTKAIRKEYKNIRKTANIAEKNLLFRAINKVSIKNFKTIVNSAEKADAIDIDTAVLFNEAFKNITPEILAAACDKSIPIAVSPYLDKDIAAFFQLKSYMELCHDEKLKGAQIRKELPLWPDATIYLFYFGEGDKNNEHIHIQRVIFYAIK